MRVLPIPPSIVWHGYLKLLSKWTFSNFLEHPKHLGENDVKTKNET